MRRRDRRGPLAALISCAIAASPAITGPAAAQQADSGSPQQPAWRLRSVGNECMLVGQLSPGDAYLAVEAIAGTDYYRFAVGGRELHESMSGALFPLTIIFQDAAARFDRRASGAALPDGGGTMIRFDGVEADVIQALGRASALSLERKGKAYGPYTFHDADKAVAALQNCMNDRLTLWGADPGQFEPGGAKPVAVRSRDDWVPNDTLLRLAYFIPRSGAMLAALMRVSVSEDGRVDGCARLEGPTDATFEKMACAAVLAKQLFRPAHDPAGKAVRGAATFEIRLASRPR